MLYKGERIEKYIIKDIRNNIIFKIIDKDDPCFNIGWRWVSNPCLAYFFNKSELEDYLNNSNSCLRKLIRDIPIEIITMYIYK